MYRSNMLKLSIIDILRRNSFGPVSAGMNKLEVIKALGEPDDFEVSEGNTFMGASIWKYAGIELHFWPQDDGSSSLALIWNDSFEFLDDCNEGKNVSLDLSFIGMKKLAYGNVESFLKEKNLNWKVYRSKLSEAYFMHFESGAGLFLEEYDEAIGPLMESNIVAIQAATPFIANNYEEVT